MGKARYMNRQQFFNVAAEGDKMGFNRQIAPWVLGKLPANGEFKVSPVLIHEHIAGMKVKPHMRTIVKFKLTNGQIGSAFIDMKMETFDCLPTAARQPKRRVAAV